MTEIDRKPRNSTLRSLQERPTRWQPAQLLPDPTPEPGYEFRWVRLSTLGASDAVNISSKLREGWEPVKASEHPEILANQAARFPDSIEIGGLMLCKTPVEFVQQRDEHYRNLAKQQMESVDSNFMRENDPRMPLFRERSSKVTSFGKGN